MASIQRPHEKLARKHFGESHLENWINLTLFNRWKN